MLFIFSSSMVAPRLTMAEELSPPKPAGTVRIATYNTSMNRRSAGLLAECLQQQDAQISAVASVIRTVQPDILLINEIDYSTETDNAKMFADHFLALEQVDSFGNGPWPMPYHFSASVNTGEPSGLDMDGDGRTDEAEDAWGFGNFPGQYGMAVLSRFEFDREQIATFQNFRWSLLPKAMRPMLPNSDKSYYPDEIWNQLRLSSKSLWDVPVTTPLGTIHLIASHPTPPAFDGAEDRNGCRNHDEIRLIQLYIEGAPELINDRGEQASFPKDASFVIVGDLNCDPVDGESKTQAMRDLLDHPRVAKSTPPASAGGVKASEKQGQSNLRQKGDPRFDTGDFNDRAIGNLRIDYAIPSVDLDVKQSGVFWFDPDDVAEEKRTAMEAAMKASDHHLVWVDVAPKTGSSN